MTIRGKHSLQTGVLFGTPQVMPRRRRAATALDRDFRYFYDQFLDVRHEPLMRSSRADDYRALKRLQALVPEEGLRRAVLDLWVEENDPFVVTHGHLLRYLLLDWRLQPMLRRAAARLRAQAPVAPVVATGPAVGARDPEKAQGALDAARMRAYRRRNGDVGP